VAPGVGLAKIASMKRIVLTLITVAALIAGARSVANAAPAQRTSTLSVAAGRAAISRFASNLRDAVAGDGPGTPVRAQVEACSKQVGVVVCMASWTFGNTRCSVPVGALAHRGIRVEELGEATCVRLPEAQPSS